MWLSGMRLLSLQRKRGNWRFPLGKVLPFSHQQLNGKIPKGNHRLTTIMQRRIYGRATDVVIRPLDEELAVQSAADLLGELFLFSVAGAAIIYEVQRNSKSEAKKKATRKQELEVIKKQDEDLVRKVQLLNQKIVEMNDLIHALGLDYLLGYCAQGDRTLKVDVCLCRSSGLFSHDLYSSSRAK